MRNHSHLTVPVTINATLTLPVDEMAMAATALVQTYPTDPQFYSTDGVHVSFYLSCLWAVLIVYHCVSSSLLFLCLLPSHASRGLREEPFLGVLFHHHCRHSSTRHFTPGLMIALVYLRTMLCSRKPDLSLGAHSALLTERCDIVFAVKSETQRPSLLVCRGYHPCLYLFS
jgi:hypothetical protein